MTEHSQPVIRTTDLNTETSSSGETVVVPIDLMDSIKIIVECDPESGMRFEDLWEHRREVEVPRATLERWQQVRGAWDQVQQEMYEFLKKAGGHGW